MDGRKSNLREPFSKGVEPENRSEKLIAFFSVFSNPSVCGAVGFSVLSRSTAEFRLNGSIGRRR
jgi:hypothetical protein